MSKRYALTARAVIHGQVQEPGYVFTLEDGEKGPHKTTGFGAYPQDTPLYVDAPDLPDPVEQEPVIEPTIAPSAADPGFDTSVPAPPPEAP